MSNDKHAPEPWKLRGNEIGKAIVSDDQNHGMMLSIAYVDKYDFEDAWESNARRIVACVNSCRGLSTKELETKGLVAAVGYQLIEQDKKIAELLIALRICHEALDQIIEVGGLNFHTGNAAVSAHDIAGQSIAKAESK